MKLSVRWIFDHLGADWKKFDVGTIVKKLNATTAEIEEVQKVQLNVNPFALATVKSVTKDLVTVECLEWNQTFKLSLRDDAQKGAHFLIKKDGKKIVWATLADWLCPKEGLLPAFACAQKDVSGGWKKQVEADDYILDVDNKSINNRPDLWGHRGFARELSALLNVPLIDEKKFLETLPIVAADKAYKATVKMPFTVKNSAPKLCRRFSSLYVESVEHRASSFWMAVRLTRIGVRAIDLLVDATNYVMLDIGQPIHAFDAKLFKDKTIEPRMAKKGEKLTLLDDSQLSLTTDDLVITDSKKPVALAGVMGGLKSGIAPTTTSMLIESANFDPIAVRLSAARHKQRTDASARFEKSLDPNQNVLGVQRFIKLLKDEKVPLKHSKALVSIGKKATPLKLKLDHTFIETGLGAPLKKGFVKKALESIGFSVVESKGTYTVTVPTFRSSKDVTIAHDVLEEIVRLFGFDNIPLALPIVQSVSRNQKTVNLVRTIKQQLAFDAQMHEVHNYMLYDNDFLKTINWKIKKGVKLANPLSEQRDTLVTSLVPHLLQNIKENSADHSNVRFFEWARFWCMNGKEVVETHSLAGIFSAKAVDFYATKLYLQKLFVALHMPIEWEKAKTAPAWASKYQTADLYCGTQKIGTAGKVSQKILARMGGSDAFAFELDGNALLAFDPVKKRFKTVPKYQATWQDISMMVSTKITVKELTKAITQADKKIFKVQLVDVFKKDEWKNTKSITMRFGMRDTLKTLSKEVIDNGYSAVQKAVKQCGAEIR